jgi:hypothetical protein
MTTDLIKLLEIASESLGKDPASQSSVPAALADLYRTKNGFLAFESSLLVLPTVEWDSIPSLSTWNAPSGWKSCYESSNDATFFAMDVFAAQIGITPHEVIRLDLESGEIEHVARNIDEWSSAVLADYSYHTGWTVAHEWQIDNHPLPNGHRLLPKQPFILGGDYVSDNLIARPLEECIRKLSGLYDAVKNTADGEAVTIKGWI